jgi:hypothetical protein
MANPICCPPPGPGLHDHIIPSGPPSPEPPLPVELIPTTPVTGVDCDGNVLGMLGVGIVQTVPLPGAVQLVKVCPTNQDREMLVLCAPDGTKVIVQNVTPEDSPLGTAPTFEAWLLDGTAYGGAVADLIDCGQEKLDLVHEPFCAAGASYTRVTFFSLIGITPSVAATLWLDVAGNVVAAPVGAQEGPCGCVALPPVGVLSTWG